MSFYLKDGIPIITYNRCRDEDNMMDRLIQSLSKIDI